MRREFSVLAEGRHIFGRSHERRSREKKRFCFQEKKLFCFQPAFRAVHYKDLTETGNCAREVSATQGNVKKCEDGLEMKNHAKLVFLKIYLVKLHCT